MDEETFNDYLLSITKIIKEEIFSEFPQEGSKQFYIYTKFNPKNKIFKIFVTLFKETDINPRETDIKFLITVNGGYPSVAPMVFCLSDVRKKIL